MLDAEEREGSSRGRLDLLLEKLGGMWCPRLWIRPRKPGRPARPPASGG